ncbi:hypothetical protein POVCU2_0001540 [Plasmodium ovale curtisi]|uniref:Uncharacterized protein n=1 Tax=Plasmodium ovale curtisi TaxID=864141 RepID=A0A1A8VIH1_PLAOA|nr:hypothetical protein POVCU2_0001540 [Plasmodium ovale curtisi]SBS80550.1 hypothetical protein POVCU1_001590 [Plasmodium ovale curtisi]
MKRSQPRVWQKCEKEKNGIYGFATWGKKSQHGVNVSASFTHGDNTCGKLSAANRESTLGRTKKKNSTVLSGAHKMQGDYWERALALMG